MIGILKVIGIWLYKVYFFLPNLAVGFCEAHFKGDLGTFITLGALFTVLGLQGMLAGLIIRLVAGRMPPTEGEENSESYEDDEENCTLAKAYSGICGGEKYVWAHVLDDDDDC